MPPGRELLSEDITLSRAAFEEGRKEGRKEEPESLLDAPGLLLNARITFSSGEHSVQGKAGAL